MGPPWVKTPSSASSWARAGRGCGGTCARQAARTLTVEVSPTESQILALGQRAGTLSLTLRTLDGVMSNDIEQISLEDLLGSKPPEVIPSRSSVIEIAPVQTIRVRRGTETVDVVIN